MNKALFLRYTNNECTSDEIDRVVQWLKNESGTRIFLMKCKSLLSDQNLNLLMSRISKLKKGKQNKNLSNT